MIVRVSSDRQVTVTMSVNAPTLASEAVANEHPRSNTQSAQLRGKKGGGRKRQRGRLTTREHSGIENVSHSGRQDRSAGRKAEQSAIRMSDMKKV